MGSAVERQVDAGLLGRNAVIAQVVGDGSGTGLRRLAVDRLDTRRRFGSSTISSIDRGCHLSCDVLSLVVGSFVGGFDPVAHCHLALLGTAQLAGANSLGVR